MHLIVTPILCVPRALTHSMLVRTTRGSVINTTTVTKLPPDMFRKLVRKVCPANRGELHWLTFRILDKLANGAVGSDLGQTPLRTVQVRFLDQLSLLRNVVRSFQNSANDRSGSEYRTKKKRNSVFSSWWTSHTSSKRRISHSTESLTSVRLMTLLSANFLA